MWLVFLGARTLMKLRHYSSGSLPTSIGLKIVLTSTRWHDLSTHRMPRFRAPAISALIALLGLALSAASQASAVFLSAGDILVSNPGIPAIIRIDPETGFQTVLSSGGSLVTPAGLAIESTGQIVVADAGAAAIIRVNPNDGSQTVVSSGGNLVLPGDLAIEGSGAIVVSDEDAAAIIRVNPNDGSQTVVSSGGGLSDAQGIAVDVNGNLVVAQKFFGVLRVDPNDGTRTLLSSGGNFRFPYGVAIDGSGNVLVADGNFGVIQVDPNGVQAVVSSGFHPMSIAIEADGNIVVADDDTHKVIRVDPASGTRKVVSSGGSLGHPQGIGFGIVVVPEVGLGQEQVPKQRRCIIQLNKWFHKISGRNGRSSESCIKDFSREEISSATECILLDLNGRVARAEAKARKVAARVCGDPLPDFGPRDIDEVITSTLELQLSLIDDIFGSDLDSAIVLRPSGASADDKQRAKCQQDVHERVQDCQRSILKWFFKCKTRGVRGVRAGAKIDSAEKLETNCLMTDLDPTTGVPDRRGEIAIKCEEKMSKEIAKECSDPGIGATSELFPGLCSQAPLTAAGFGVCIRTLIQCRDCEAINSADHLGRDCDLFDDGLANLSCPP